MDPWSIELVVVHGGSHDGAERRALSRDVAKGRYLPIRPSVYVPTPAPPLLTEERHVLQIRALAAVAATPPVFSHWSAMLLHGLEPYRARIADVHVTVPPNAFRGRRASARTCSRSTPPRSGRCAGCSSPRSPAPSWT